MFEVHIIVNLPDNTKPRNVKVTINANDMECKVHDSILFKVELPNNYVINSSLFYVETIRCRLVGGLIYVLAIGNMQSGLEVIFDNMIT